MLHTTTIAVIAGGAVALLLTVLLLLHARRRRRQRDEYADLPALLYFAGNAPASGGAAAAHTAMSPAAWASVRAPSAPPAKAVAWGPSATETTQLLPGCLRPESGGEEIRFAARQGEQRFTLGRSRGPARSHIQLSAPTVSRMHAWMELSEGEWRVGRLSQTNDVVVNGLPVAADSAQPLRDGDRIELGDTVFTFHHIGTRAEASDDD